MGLFNKNKAEKMIRFDFDMDLLQALEDETTVGKYATGPITKINMLVRGTMPFQNILASLEDAMGNGGRKDLPAHLEREPDNAHDEFATKVIVAGHHVGYLAREVAAKCVVELDAIESAGKFLAGKVIFVGDGSKNLGLRFDMPDLKKLVKTL